MIYLLILVLLLLVGVALFAMNKKVGDEPQLRNDYLELVDILSQGNQQARSEVQLFFDKNDDYFNQYEDDLLNRGIESSEDIPPVIVLVDALIRHDKVVYQDHAAEPGWALASLNKLSNAVLDKSEGYWELMEHYKSTKYGLGTFLDKEGYGPSIFQCVKSQGYRLLSIDEGSDSYALILVEEKDLPELIRLSQKAGVKISYLNK